MTAEELGSKLNIIYGLKEWPLVFEVDHETYANVCQYIFSRRRQETIGHIIDVAIGGNEGIMFRGIELILRK